MTDFNFDFYSIEKFGFYKRSASVREFGAPNRIWDDYAFWIKDKSIKETRTFEKGDVKNILPVYCSSFAIDPNTQDAVLVTWNETMNDDGVIQSLNGNSNVGETSVELSEVPEDHIPGYASYFWFIDSLNLLCCLRPENSPFNGHYNLKYYMKRFIEIAPSFIVLNEKGDIMGHSDSVEVKKVYPKFETSMLTKSTDFQAIKARLDRVYKVIKKNHIEPDSANDGIAKAILKDVFLSESDIIDVVDQFYKVEINYEPSVSDFDGIVDGWRKSYNGNSDIGFMLRGDSSPVWLSRSLERHESSLDIDRRDSGTIFSASQLLEAINESREGLVGMLSNENG